jgi:type IV secretory pathway TrbD component
MTSTYEYSRQVHRALLQRDLTGGIPTTGFLLIFVLAVIFLFGLEMWFMIIPIVVLYFVMLVLTKKDPWLLDIVANNLMQEDIYSS